MHAHAAGPDAGRALTVPWGSEPVTLQWHPPIALSNPIDPNASPPSGLAPYDPMPSDLIRYTPAPPTSPMPAPRYGTSHPHGSPTTHQNSAEQSSRLRPPGPERLTVGVFRSLVEVLTGLRPASQLIGIAHPDARAALTILTAQERWSDATLLSVRCCVPCAGVVEGSATLRRHDRIVAATTRLEHPDSKWLLRHLAVLEPCALARQRAAALGLRP